MSNEEELESILNTMNIPSARKKDLGWLNRNIEINNGQHPDIDRALQLIKIIAKGKK